jgi:predicted GNAT family acetyltransferase
MPDKIKDAFEAIKGSDIFLDEQDFREQLTKSPKDVYGLFSSNKQTKDLFLDYSDFENSFDLKKKEPTIPPLGQAFKLGGENTPQLPLTSQSKLGEKPKAKLTNIDPNKIYVKPQGKTKDFVEPIAPITEDKATQETFLSNNKKRNEYLENFSNTILDVANKVPESFFYQKNKPTLWGTKEIEAGTINVDGVSKAIDLEAEKIQREQGVTLSSRDKQYLITNITNKLQSKKEVQNANAVTDAQLQKELGYNMTDITGIKMPDGKVVKKGYFEEAKNKIEQTYQQEKNSIKKSAPIVQKTLDVEFAPEIEKARQDVEINAKLKSEPINAEFDQLYKQEFDKYQSLVNSEQMTVEQANVELAAKKDEILKVLTPKFEQINEEAKISYDNSKKEIQSRYNKKYQNIMQAQESAANQRIKKIQDEYSGKVPEEFLKRYAELLNKNIGYELQKTANQNLQNFRNLAVTEKLNKAMMAGWSDVTSTIGGAMGYAGFDTSGIAEITAKTGVLNPMPEGGYEDANIMEKIADTDWWIANGVRALPFSITTMPIGIFGGAVAGTVANVLGAAKRTQVIASVLGGGAVGWEAETFLEAGGAYQQAINEGKSEEEASEIASNTMKFNLSTLPLNVLQMMPIFGGGFKALKVLEKPALQGFYGGIEEIFQGWSQAKANAIQEGKDVDLFDYAMSPQAMEEGAIGFAMGQGMAVLSLDNTPDVDKQISTLMSSLSVGGEAQARKVLDIMKTNGAISEKEYNENINLLNYTLEGIKNVESFPIEDNLKLSLVNKYVGIAKAKQLHTDDENDLASQASKEMVAEREKEIKEILKGSEPVYLAFVKGSEVPIVTSKEEIDYILSNERGLEVFDLEVYNDESTNNKIQKAKEDLIITPQEITTEPTSTEGVEANVVEPTEEQILQDFKDKNFVTFTYNNESEVPEQFKDKISSKGEINGKTFVNVTLPKSVADYELAKSQQTPITQNKDEKTNEVREIEDGQNETKNEGIKSKGKNDGQKTNDVQNEEVTEGGVKAPQVKTIKNQIADLRAAEQAEYDAMSNPKDKAKREEIYNRYDKLITPLLEQEKAGSESKSSEPSKSDKNYQEAQEVNAIVSKENPEASVLIQPKGEDLSLTAVYVGKEKRGKGIGSKVLESVKKQADKLGKKVVLDATNELDSETDLEKLDNFYKKNGFLKIGKNKYEYDPKAKDSSGDIGSRTDDSGTKKSDIAAVANKGQSDKNVDSAEEVAETSKPKPENVKAIEEAMTKKSGTIKNEIIKEAANPTEVKKILDNLDAIKSKLAGLTTKDGDSVFSEECKWG